MENNNLKISVVTVSYNAAKTIEETILSVVDQTYDNIEYIIIDGGSTDGTVDIIKKYANGGSEFGKHNHNISYWVSEPDRGIYDAMNKGIAAATGDYINFMNAGDSFVNINVVESVFNNHNSADVIYGDTLNRFNGSLKISKARKASRLKKEGILCHQSAFIDLNYHKSHPFDLNYNILADYNFFFKAYNKDHLKFHQIDIPVSIFDMSDGGASKLNYSKNYKEYIEIISDFVSPVYITWLKIRRIGGILRRRFCKSK